MIVKDGRATDSNKVIIKPNSFKPLHKSNQRGILSVWQENNVQIIIKLILYLNQ
jgi:hypothetical protein